MHQRSNQEIPGDVTFQRVENQPAAIVWMESAPTVPWERGKPIIWDFTWDKDGKALSDPIGKMLIEIQLGNQK